MATSSKKSIKKGPPTRAQESDDEKIVFKQDEHTPERQTVETPNPPPKQEAPPSVAPLTLPKQKLVEAPPVMEEDVTVVNKEEVLSS